MIRVLILKPRLDVPFKDLSNGYVPTERGPIIPMRKHWERFCEKKIRFHEDMGDHVDLIEMPLWKMTPSLIEGMGYDLVYIPHRERHNFPIVDSTTAVLYYMQSVFPWQFYVDEQGFAGGMKEYPFFFADGDEAGKEFDELQSYVLSGKSKFDQPESGRFRGPGEYVLFTCQIPHDQTILHHSNVTVQGALEVTCMATKAAGYTLVVKGHPVNPGSMEELKQIAAKYTNVLWIDSMSIQDAITNAKCVVTVNSGTGMEALLLKKPVATFGRADYDCVTVNVATIDDLSDFIKFTPRFDEVKVRKFFNKWYQETYDTRN